MSADLKMRGFKFVGSTICYAFMQAGGKVAMPKFAIPGMAWQGYFLDMEGNTFGVHQEDKRAK